MLIFTRRFMTENFSEGSPLQFFDDLRDRMDKKSQRVPWLANSVQLLGFSGTVEENT